MSVVSIEKFEVLPQNQPANNTYSFKSGNPIITFSIGSTNKNLRPSTLRLNGKFTVKKGDGTRPNNSSLVGGRAAGTVECSSRVGIHSCFQNVNISSNDTNSTLESVRQYGRLAATVLPSTHDSQDFLCQAGLVSQNTGLRVSSSVMKNNTMSFSLPIYSGLLMGGNLIPLGQNGVRGLHFSFELASDQQVLFGGNAGDGTGASYELSDLSLTGDMEILDAEGQSKMAIAGTGAFSYNSYTNLYSVIDSADSTQTYNLAQSNVLSVFHNFLPVTQANNYGFDGFATGELLNTGAGGVVYDTATTLKRVGFSRAGVKLGLDYDLVCETQSAAERPETGVMINSLDAVKQVGTIKSTLSQPLLLGFGGGDQVIYQKSGLQQGTTVDTGSRNFAIGLAVDRFSDVGMDFRGSAYSTRIQSTLDGKSPNSVYSYVLSKNTLQYSPQGIMVMS